MPAALSIRRKRLLVTASKPNRHPSFASTLSSLLLTLHEVIHLSSHFVLLALGAWATLVSHEVVRQIELQKPGLKRKSIMVSSQQGYLLVNPVSAQEIRATSATGSRIFGVVEHAGAVPGPDRWRPWHDRYCQ